MEQESANNNYAEDYYVEAFHKLKKENENSWNFGAAIGGTAWLIYRKMYAYAFLFTLLDLFIIFTLNVIVGEKFGHVYFLIVFPIRVFVFGHYGNKVYYEIVKEKISKGYHLAKKYHLFSNSLVIIAVIIGLIGLKFGWAIKMSSEDLLSKWIGLNLFLLFLAGSCFIINRIACAYYKIEKNEDEKFDYSEENIRRHLKHSEHLFDKISSIVFWLYIFGKFWRRYTYREIVNGNRSNKQ